jgi:hypothetical protein
MIAATTAITDECPAFINRLRLMSSFPHRLLVISAVLSQMKSRYAHSNINPNRILQSLIAVVAGLNIPVLCTETHELGEEVVASYLYQIHLYDWLETNNYGRFLVDNALDQVKAGVSSRTPQTARDARIRAVYIV